MSIYYDRAGSPMTAAQRAKVSDRYYRIAETVLPTGYWVSTVWLGLNHRFGDNGPPLIFETMVFPCDVTGNVTAWGELDSDRYSTEEEARIGHAAMVEKWTHKGLEA